MTETRPSGPGPRRVPLVRAAAIALTLLAGLPLVIALGVSLAAGLGTAIELFSKNGTTFVQTYVARVRDELRPAEQAVEGLAAQVGRGELEISDRDRLDTALRAVLLSHPSLHSLGWIGRDGTRRFAVRGADATVTIGARAPGATPVHRHRERDDRPLTVEIDGWDMPAFLPGQGITVLPFGVMVTTPQGRVGAIIATLGLDGLSRIVQRASEGSLYPVHPFVLLGQTYVIAHPRLADGAFRASALRPLPLLDELDDAQLAGIWAPGWEQRRLKTVPIGHHGTGVNDDTVYLYEEIRPRGSPLPWYVGLYGAQGLLGDELRRLGLAGLAGIAVLVAALVAATWLARRLARPVAALAENARALTALDLEHTAPLARSRIAELDDAAVAMNRMVAALRVFARYVPRRLVERLLADGLEQRPSLEREVTVLFCDIVGFTAFAEKRSPTETASALNAHFARLAAAIEAEAGTIDKYMGDALMAFWNAPDRQPDHALRAVRAAQAIAGRDDPGGFRMRIGIHTGRAVVGDLGAPQRLNYTIVGDTVNIAQRLEQLGRVLRREDPVAVLISEATASALPEGAVPLASLGPRRVRGRAQAIEVFALISPVRRTPADAIEVPA